MLNRMMLAIAARVRAFASEVTDEDPIEVSDPFDLPPGRARLLIVGRQHIAHGDHKRFGYEVLEPALARCDPSACIYVVPTILDPWVYRRDIEAILDARAHTPTYVLEFATLRDLPQHQAVTYARQVLARYRPAPEREAVPLLLPPAGESLADLTG